ncbi:hypothetical protein [Fibrobacter sp. UWB12]|uniref:hypothetical protein n=1 Tax=Fibrobacter sp. UWB12 TaxID=1896203 RepID=UPI000917EAD4|nr:hypothetical protein [Fibrobacter sp. UWB12]SHK63570.1 hypothetical protein SAMN05720759_104294 [Fibrobacter sp. UWB12]
MISFIRKQWGNFAFSLASFFWAGCGNGEISTADDIDCNVDLYAEDDTKCPTPDIKKYIETSSSSVESSSSSIPRMSAPAYGIDPVNCYTTSIKNSEGSSYQIFECDNGYRYLKDFRAYPEELKSTLPEDILWRKPYQGTEGKNCNFNGVPLCVDKWDTNQNVLSDSGCEPTIECPDKPEE